MCVILKRTLIISVLLSVVAAVTLLTLCILYIRHLCLKCITAAINDKFPTPPPYQLSQHAGEIVPLVSLSEPGEDETEDYTDAEEEEDRCLYS